MSYYLELFLTRNCNQNCYYCNIFTHNEEVEVDIERLKHVLTLIPTNTTVEMTGGEIGLIINIDDVFKTIYDHKNIKGIIALSNGLIRQRGVDWLDKVEYVEHLIADIKGRHITKFYNMDFIDGAKNIIVATETTVTSLLENWNFFKKTEFVTDKFFIKLMNNKTHDIKNYSDKAIHLFTLLKDSRQIFLITSFNNPEIGAHKKLLCEANSPSPFIDFDQWEIGHCAIEYGETKRLPFTIKNIKRLPYGDLFGRCEYCDKCYSFDDGKNKIRYIMESRKGNFKNRDYAYTTK